MFATLPTVKFRMDAMTATARYVRQSAGQLNYFNR